MTHVGHATAKQHVRADNRFAGLGTGQVHYESEISPLFPVGHPRENKTECSLRDRGKTETWNVRLSLLRPASLGREATVNYLSEFALAFTFASNCCGSSE